MIRTQVQLTESQMRELKRVAIERGVSIAELVRQAVDGHLGSGASPDARRQRALLSIGGFRSGRSDVSVDHDDHLADAFGA